MKLPGMGGAALPRSVQTVFGGYDRRSAAGDGSLRDMENLTGAEYPLLAVRPPRRILQKLTKPNGLFCAGETLCFVDGCDFYYGDSIKGRVSDSPKVFAALGRRILIWPDKVCYDPAEDSFTALESAVTCPAGTLRFADGSIYGEAAEANSICSDSLQLSAFFKVGDCIRISGCTARPENNKEVIIREISEDGRSLHCYEYSFSLPEGAVSCSEPGAVTLAREVPELDYLCVNENRVWGCRGDSIRGCKLGDPTNWNVFDGLSTDSFALEAGSVGDFTGCAAYLGYPTFFKEGQIYKLYGSLPSNFELLSSAGTGVAAGSGRSIAAAGETLYYLASSGPVAYAGGSPASVAAAFAGARLCRGVAGSDGRRWFLNAEEDGRRQLFVYDSASGLWHREDGLAAAFFARMGEKLFCLTEEGQLLLLGDTRGETLGEDEGSFPWFVQFGDFTGGTPDKKSLTRLLLRLEAEAGSRLQVLLRCDSGPWERVAEVRAGRKRSVLLPLLPRRADHFCLRLEGEGPCRIHSLTREAFLGRER